MMGQSPVRRVGSIVLVLAIAIAIAGAAAAAQHVALTDPQITAQIEHKLLDRHITGVGVSVREGVATLRGTVPSLWARDEAIAQARKADDVKDVIVELAIAAGESDLAVAEGIASRIRRYVFFTVFDDVDVEVTGGVATLTGAVTMPYKLQEMARLAAHVTGVQRVVNDIRTLPVSTFDDQIRYAVASRIYNDPMFWNYAIQVSPPIHILVDGGRVTLTGVVGSEVERRMAEILAREVFGIFSVTNKLRLGE